MIGDPDPEFWRILCQIRIVKYCAEPSVRELPKHEGSLQRRSRFTELLRISPASPEHYPGTPAIRNSSNQTDIATCHDLRWRQRYCQTRYMRRNYLCRDLCINAIWLVIPAISRIARSLNRKDRGRQQTYECTCNDQMDIAVRIDKSRTDSVACNVTTGHNLAVARYASRSYTCNNQDDTGMQHSTETML